MTNIIGLALAICTIIIGLWKWYFGKKRKRAKDAEQAKKLLSKGVDEEDVSAITRAFDRLRGK